MKLHLPTGLRSALFACFAAVASLGATLATATVAGGVFAVSVASVAQAEDYTSTSSGEIKAKKSGDTQVALNAPTQDDKITFETTGGYLPNTDAEYTIAADVVFGNLKLDNGYSGNVAENRWKNYNFTGDVTGTGTFERTNAQFYNRYVFSGDVSGFTGTMKISSNGNGNALRFITDENNSKTIACDVTLANNSLLEVRTADDSLGALIVDGKKVTVGNGNTDRSSLSMSSLELKNGAWLSLNHAKGTDFSAVSLTLNEGTTLEMWDSNSGNGQFVADPYGSAISFGKTTVNDAVTISYYWKGALRLSEVTGEGTLTFAEAQSVSNDPRATILSAVRNFNGTITGTPTQHRLYVEAVHQDAGYSALIKGVGEAVYSRDFSKTGAGDLVIVGSLAVDRTLTMNYEGGLYSDEEKTAAGLQIGSVSGTSSLAYNGLEKTLDLGYDKLAGHTTVQVDLSGLWNNGALAKETINLGISGMTEAEMAALEGQLRVCGFVDDFWSLALDGDKAVLNMAEGATLVAVEWDDKWESELTEAPVLRPVNYTYNMGDGYMAIGAADSPYLSEGKSAIVLMEGGGDGAYVFGGANGAPATLESWIDVKGGKWFAIGGGNYPDNWDRDTAANYQGDSHIQVDGGTVQYIIGAHYKDGQTPNFTGSTYISVKGGEIGGSIVGGGASVHSGGCRLDGGDTNIYVYTPLSVNSGTALHSATPNAVIGGHLHAYNTLANRTMYLDGNTNITVDLSAYSGESVDFVKTLIGGHYMAIGNGGLITAHVTGNSTISVTATDKVTFKAGIVGATDLGNMWGDSTAKLDGDTNISLDGGIYGDGTDVFNVIGGMLTRCADPRPGYTVSVGGTANITLKSGTLAANSNIIAGSYIDDGVNQETDDKPATFSQGGSKVQLQGGSVGGFVTGGFYIEGTGENQAKLGTATIGSILVTVDGAAVTGPIYGGSINNRANDASVVNQGAVTVELLTGSVGEVYAAGWQNGTAVMTTGSTEVKINSAVTFSPNGSVVSGGYKGGSADSAKFTDDAVRTLSLTDSTAYGNLSGVDFRDFDVLNVVSDASIKSLTVTGTSLTKQGDGKLVITGGGDLSTLTRLDIAGGLNTGTDALSGGLTSVTLAAGSSLATAGLSLSSTAQMSLDLTGVTANDALVQAGALSLLAGGADDKITLVLNGLDGLAFGTYKLMDWTSGDLTVDQLAWDGAGELRTLSVVDNALLLTLDSPWKWQDGNGTWKDAEVVEADNWFSDSGTPKGQDVLFGDEGLSDGAAVVTIEGAVEPNTITVQTTGTYTFAGDSEDDTIAAGSLTKLGTGTLVIQTVNSSEGNMTIGAGTVNIDGGSWKGAIAVNGTGQLTISSVGANGTIGAITAQEDATTTVVGSAGGVTLGQVSGGNLVANTAAGNVTIAATGGDANPFTSVTNNGTGTLTFGSAVTIGTLDNSGTIMTQGSGVTLTAATAKGGILDTMTGKAEGAAAGTVTLTGDNTFAGLKAGYVEAGSGKVTLTGASSVHEFSGGKTSLVITDGVTEIRGGSTLASLALSESGTAKLDVTGGALTVSGDITLGAASTGTPLADAGIDADVNIDVVGSATVTGAVSAKYRIQIGGAADVEGSVTSSESFVSIGGEANIGDTDSTNGLGGISAKDYVSITGLAKVEGSVSVTDNYVSIGGNATVGGDVTAGQYVTIGGEANIGDTDSTNGLGGISAKDYVSITGLAKVEGSVASSDNYVSIGGDATVGGDITAGKYVTIGGVADVTGSLTATAGDVTLTKGGSIGGDLTVTNGKLVLGGALEVEGANGITGALTGISVLADTTLAATTPLVDAASVALGDSFTLNFESIAALEKFGLDVTDADAANDSLTVIAVTGTALAELTADKLFLSIGDAAPSGNVYEHNAVVYTLAQSEDQKSITLSAMYTGRDWNSSDGTWSDVDDWDPTGLPNSGTNVVFGGKGTPAVSLETAQVVKSVLIDTEKETTEPVEYTFSGEALTAGTVSVQTGAMVIANDITVTGETVVGPDAPDATTATGHITVRPTGTLTTGSLLVNEQGGLLVDGAKQAGGTLVAGSMTVLADATEDGSLGFTNAGTTTVSGKLDATDRTIANMGSLSVGDGTVIGSLVGTGSFSVSAGTATVGNIDGASALSIADAGTLNVTAGTADAPASLSVGSLSGSGSLVVANTDLEITEAATGSVSVTAKSLTLTTSGHTFGALAVDSYTLDVSALQAGNVSPLLSATSFTTTTFDLTLTGIDSLIVSQTGALAGDYLLMETGSTDVLNVTLNDAAELKQAFALAGTYAADVIYEVKAVSVGGNIVLRVAEESSDPDYVRVWNTSSDYAGALEVGGASDPDGALSAVANKYDALLHVGQVVVDTDTTIDLTGDADVMEERHPQGLTIRNLTGEEGYNLALVGTEDDLATLINDQDTRLDGSLIVDGMNVAVEPEVAGAILSTGSTELVGEAASISVSPTADYRTGALLGTEGTVSGKVTINGKGGDYSGNYDAATIYLTGNAEQVLAPKAGLTVAGDGGTAVLDLTRGNVMQAIATTGASIELRTEAPRSRMGSAAAPAGYPLTLKAPSSMVGGTLSFGVKGGDVLSGLNGGSSPVITKGAALNLTGTAVVVTQQDAVTNATFDLSQGTEDRTLIRLADSGTAKDVALTLKGEFFERYFENERLENGAVVADIVTDYYGRRLGQTENGRAGLAMLDYAVLSHNPQALAPEGDVAKVLNALDAHVASGDAAAADTLAAAVAGAGVAGAGSAVLGDVDRQLKAIRNRMTSMGVDQCVVNEDMPYVNAWINAEGDYREMSADQTLAGYTLSSWGGTVGMDVDVSPSLTFGLAATAMYGDYDGDSADVVSGDIDSYYLSAFARVVQQAWVHSFVATVGRQDITLKRMVNYGEGSYSTDGDTGGLSFGLMYEVGRTIALDEDATTCWQPVFNVQYRHVGIDGYTETGSDAALRFGDQTLNMVTFGLGARLQTAFGENVYNRTSLFEVRALAKLDAGDRASEADVTFAAMGSHTSKVKGAEMGAFGVELGAGLTVPVGQEGGSLFFDASLEVRADYTNVNGTVGYRINF